jgi:hypothetical protein
MLFDLGSDMDETLRGAASIKAGTVAPSALIPTSITFMGRSGVFP